LLTWPCCIVSAGSWRDEQYIGSFIGEISDAFTVVTFILLAFAHYLIIRQRKISIANRAVVWLSTIVALGIVVYMFVT
jgi:hypothetical protein